LPAEAVSLKILSGFLFRRKAVTMGKIMYWIYKRIMLAIMDYMIADIDRGNRKLEKYMREHDGRTF
jgi:hypothetical protein